MTKTYKDKNKNLFKVNTKLTRKALILAKQLNCKNFFFISSTSVYRKFSKYKYNEKSKTSAQDSYSKSKLKGEKISKDFCNKHKIKLTILRIGNIYLIAELFRSMTGLSLLNLGVLFLFSFLASIYKLTF